jgi:hypothetical protein
MIHKNKQRDGSFNIRAIIHEEKKWGEKIKADSLKTSRYLNSFTKTQGKVQVAI